MPIYGPGSVSAKQGTIEIPPKKKVIQESNFYKAHVDQPSFAPIFESGGGVLPWASFPEDFKQKVRAAYKSSWAWLELCWAKYGEYVKSNVKPPDF
jgi:hypothetical protein